MVLPFKHTRHKGREDPASQGAPYTAPFDGCPCPQLSAPFMQGEGLSTKNKCDEISKMHLSALRHFPLICSKRLSSEIFGASGPWRRKNPFPPFESLKNAAKNANLIHHRANSLIPSVHLLCLLSLRNVSVPGVSPYFPPVLPLFSQGGALSAVQNFGRQGIFFLVYLF